MICKTPCLNITAHAFFTILGQNQTYLKIVECSCRTDRGGPKHSSIPLSFGALLYLS